MHFAENLPPLKWTESQLMNGEVAIYGAASKNGQNYGCSYTISAHEITLELEPSVRRRVRLWQEECIRDFNGIE